MIRIEGLTKRYGDLYAIRDVSFEVGKGEVVGFLGPNGAGKTTTMRILCGCIGATSGRAMIDGIDVMDHPKLAKRRIGYLPEIPPLYRTMVVRDYVAFAGRLKGIEDPEGAAEQVMARVGLAEVAHRIIGHLSKGYRQRVGLAQALVHQPEVLVLDEPTSGLDPAQRREIRDLLVELAKGERTVVLSTHVLAEVEAVCERVVIINQGRVVAQDTIDALASQSHRVRLRVTRSEPALGERLRGIPHVIRVNEGVDGAWHVTAEADVREQIARAAIDFGLVELGAEDRLEDVYLRLTRSDSDAAAVGAA